MVAFTIFIVIKDLYAIKKIGVADNIKCSGPKYNVRKEKQMAYKFEIYKDKKGEYRFRFRAPNGQPMFSGQGYKSKASATNAIASIKKNVADAVVDDQS